MIAYKKKLLFLIGDYGTGGKERQLTEIIKRLPKKTYAVNLFMKNDSSYYFETIKEQLASYYSLEKKNFGIMDIFSLKHFIISVQPQIVFSFSTTLSHYALLLKLIGPFQYRLINGSIRDAPIKFNFFMSSEKLLYNFYKEVVANSKSGLNAYDQTGKKGRHVLYNGFDEKRIPKTLQSELRRKLKINDKFIVVMVASMGESKDHFTFIKAAKKVLSIDDDIQFILIGDGPKKLEYLALVLSMGLEKDILFTGEVNNVEEYLKLSNLSVLMSTNAEGFPNVVLESLACGTPVIAIKDGGTREVLKNNFNGYLINKSDYINLAKKILLLKNSDNILDSFSRNGIKTIKNNFLIDKMVSNFEMIMEFEV